MKNKSFIVHIATIFSLISFIIMMLLWGLSTNTWASISAPSSGGGLDLWKKSTAAADSSGVTLLTSDSVLESDYFGAKYISGITQAEPFGSWDNLDSEAINTTEEKWQSIRISAGDYSKKETLGVWYRNVGNYQGFPVDLKVTLTDYEFYQNKEGEQSQMILWSSLDKIASSTAGSAWISIRYDYYNAESGEPVSMKNYMTFNDIDWGQTIEITNNPGTLYVPENSNLRTLTTNSGNLAFLSDKSWYNDSSEAAHISAKEDSFMTMFEGSSQTQTFYCGYYFRDDVFDKNNFLSAFNDSEGLKNLITARDYFDYTGQPLAATAPSTPSKIVSDSDESGTENTLSSLSEEFTYSIYHNVPNENPENYYSSYQVEDSLANCLDFISASVYNESNQDVSDHFSVSYKDGLLTITAKNTSSASFYYDTYRYDIKVKIKKDADISNFLQRNQNGQLLYSIPNQADIVISRNETIRKTSNSTSTYLTTLYTDGSLIIHKSDANSGKNLDNAGFTLYEWDCTKETYHSLDILSYQEDSQTYVYAPLTATIANEGRFKVVETTVPDTYEGSWEKEFILSQDKEVLEYQVTNAPSGGNTITKTAVVISNGQKGKELSGSKDSPVMVESGDTIEYHIQVTRKSTPGYKSGTITITDKIPSQAIWDKNSLTISGKVINQVDNSQARMESMEEKDGRIIWTASHLDHGEGLLLTFRIKAPAKAVLLKNTACMKLDGQKTVKSETTYHQIQLSSLEAEKSSSPATGSTVKKGSLIRYSITITNNGEADAKNVIITDSLPKGTSYVDKSISSSLSGSAGSYDSENRTVYAILPLLKKGSKETLTFKVSVNKDSNVTEIKNVAQFKEASTDTPEEELFNGKHFSSTNTTIHTVTSENLSITRTPSSSGSSSNQTVVSGKNSGATSSSTNPVKTGDHSHIIVWILLLIIASLPIAIHIIHLIKSKKESSYKE